MFFTNNLHLIFLQFSYNGFAHFE